MACVGASCGGRLTLRARRGLHMQAVRQAEHLALLKLTDNKQQEEHRKQTDNLKKMLQVRGAGRAR